MKRRGILSMAAAALAGLALAPPATMAATPGAMPAPAAWQAHFAALDHGAILADRAAQVVHFWS
ncbi:MAG: L,D-transpeptidase, partial [Cereibacter changlensis]